MEIPKIIHYCWFGGKELPELALRCIESWQKYLPEYEIKRWDETNYDINSCSFIKEAYKAKKYAFVSDYARLDILYKYGGLYFDTDVEVIKPMQPIVDKGPFMGCENSYVDGMLPLNMGVNPGLGIATYKGHPFYKEILEMYKKISFNPNHMITIVTYVTNELCKSGLQANNKVQSVCGINIYPKEFFCPIDYETGELSITPNSYSIHHYSASWHGPKEKFYKFLCSVFGHNNMKNFVNMIRK